MPTLELERGIFEKTGMKLIAGIDEAGRGAIAGPVVAAAVVLPLEESNRIERLNEVDDSKKLSVAKREALLEIIIDNASSWGVASVGAKKIDEIGIIPANAEAMRIAISQLDPPPQYLLIDGRMRLKNLSLLQESIIRGDGLSLSIAAASILAKVTRDHMMVSLNEKYPQYGFSQHKGYCTRGHVSALEKHGPSEVHRHSFAPLKPTLL
jgi:ribonuclease HII